MKIGYARVSTRDQNADMQVDALQLAGCERIYQDVARFNGGLEALVKHFGGDVSRHQLCPPLDCALDPLLARPSLRCSLAVVIAAPALVPRSRAGSGCSARGRASSWASSRARPAGTSPTAAARR